MYNTEAELSIGSITRILSNNRMIVLIYACTDINRNVMPPSIVKDGFNAICQTLIGKKSDCPCRWSSSYFVVSR